MLARRSAAEVLTRQQHFAFPVSLLVKDKVRIQRPVTAILARLTLVKVPPGVKQIVAKARFFNRFKKLLGNNRVRVDVAPIDRDHNTRVLGELFHVVRS